MKQKKILIIGAGISGLSLAISLQKRNIPFRIIERQKDWAKKGLAMSIQGEGIKASSSLGILDEIKKHGTKRNLKKILNSDDQILKNISTDFKDHSFVIRRDIIHNVLRSRVPKVEMGITVISITKKNNNIEVLFSDKSTDTYHIAVGSDGINSKTREYITVSNKITKNKSIEYSGYVLWGFTLPKKYKEIIEVWDNNKMCAMYPVDQGTVFSFFMNESETFYSPKQERQKYLKEHFSSFVNKIIQEALQILPDDIFFDHVRYTRPMQWSRGKVVLIGDACHSLSPLSGLGANLAMADAEGLAQIITLSTNDNELLTQLSFFNSIRRVEADKAYLLSKLRTKRSMLTFPGNIIRNNKMKHTSWTY